MLRYVPFLCILIRILGHVRNEFGNARVVPAPVARLSSVCAHELENLWMDFHKISCWVVFLKSVDTFQFQLKSDTNNGHFTNRYTRVCLPLLKWPRNRWGKSPEIPWYQPTRQRQKHCTLKSYLPRTIFIPLAPFGKIIFYERARTAYHK